MDGLLYHESDLRIEEHYTDTAGFTDHLSALMHLLGFRFAPRIRDLIDKSLYIHDDAKQYPTLASLIGGNVNVKHIRARWDEVLRLAASIKQGTVTASLMLRRLGSYPRRTAWPSPCEGWGVQIGLNKGEAKNALDRAVHTLRDSGININERPLPDISPLGWEHINLTGNYIWRQNKQVVHGKFRPLRIPT